MNKVVVGIVATAFGLAGCGKSEKKVSEEEAPLSTPAVKEAGQAQADKVPPRKVEEPKYIPEGFSPSAAIAQAGNALYIATETDLISISEGKFTRVAKLPKFLNATAIAVDKDGGIWVLGASKLLQRKGKSWVTHNLSDGNGALRHLAVESVSNIDVAGVYGLSHFNGKTWALTKTKELLGKQTVIRDLLMDDQGTGYAISPSSLLYRENGAWAAIEGTDRYSAMDLDAKGTVALAGMKGLFIKTAGEPQKKLDTERCTSPKEISLRAGKLIAQCNQSLMIVDGESGAALRVGLGKDDGMDIGRVEMTASDSRGQVYIVGTSGFFVRKPDGAMENYRVGTVPLLASGIHAILAVGAGPDTLPEHAPVQYGAVKGKLSKKRKALENVDIEMCTVPESQMNAHISPCAEGTWHTESKTGPDGSFSFEKVPKGKMRFIYNSGSGWVEVFGADCCSKLGEGKTLNLGRIDLM